MSISEANMTSQSGVEAANITVQRMANPGGCAWHEVQTHESLIPFLIEETAEFVDAVERGLPASEVAEELGDVLYQVLFHAAIASRDGEGYDLDSVASRLDEKLRARHPHVFGNRGYMSVEELNAEWERLKEDANGERRGSRGALEGIPAGMPTLARAAKVVERLKRAGLVDPSAALNASELGKVEAGSLNNGKRSAGAQQRQELPTTEQTNAHSSSEKLLGDEILALVIKANAAGIDPDRALRLATVRLADSLTGDRGTNRT